jgi:hypothetical protein
MKVLSSRLIKFAAVAAILASGFANATSPCGCEETATRYAQQARDAELAKMSTCDQYKSDPTAYNNCTAQVNAKAQSQYTYVYNSAYSACRRSCPV